MFQTVAEAMKCDNHLDWVFGSAFTNDGSRLATVSRDRCKLIDIATGHLIDDINRTRDSLLCLSRHPSEDLIARGDRGQDSIVQDAAAWWAVGEGDNKEESLVREFEHMASPIQCIAFSPDGVLVACGAVSGEVRIFKTEMARSRRLQSGARSVFAIAFVADGKQIATGGYDGLFAALTSPAEKRKRVRKCCDAKGLVSFQSFSACSFEWRASATSIANELANKANPIAQVGKDAVEHMASWVRRLRSSEFIMNT